MCPVITGTGPPPMKAGLRHRYAHEAGSLFVSRDHHLHCNNPHHHDCSRQFSHNPILSSAALNPCKAFLLNSSGYSQLHACPPSVTIQ